MDENGWNIGWDVVYWMEMGEELEVNSLPHLTDENGWNYG